jgi:IMP dehydrogenase
MRLRKAYSFNDVMLVPRRSSLHSRADADLSTKIAGIELKVPVIAANMSSVCETDMAVAIGEMGGLGIVHRMCTVEEQATMIQTAHTRLLMSVMKNTVVKSPNDYAIGFSIGVGDDWRERIDACRKAGGSIACLDIAHAHHVRVIEILDKYFGIYKNFPLIIGQVATPSAVREILNIHNVRKHIDTIAFKTSIGGGSLCTTRIKTGFGVPTLQAVMDIHEEFPGIGIIADGGIKESGDIVKSLAAGASAVMLGNLLAGTDEAPGKIIKSNDQLFKVYRGSASFGDKALRGEQTRNVEGEETLVPYKGAVQRVVENLLDGVRSGFSYGGAATIKELQDDIEFIEISTHGYQESLPHGK